MFERGVTDTTAADLVKRRPSELIKRQIDVFDWLVANQDKRVSKNPAGYLVKSIDTGETGYKAPAGFVSRAERQAIEERRQAQERDTAETRRQEEDQLDREREMRQRAEAYRNGLDQAGRAALEAAALAATTPGNRDLYNSSRRQSWSDTLMLNYIANYLAANPELEQLAVEA